ncbi:RxLR-like protein [Plasmopara halstedii]|uniref:RxLR-like protein n=1 Tax=Plasmopara halstedii TaxID=4781 RepID=A0A0P1AMJ8_PLAHL|nr:RxLR-like protein [Plasmopara halstedii]CEG42180.1 RxLR-like protein [Plasmopara halstedii]|eukprot:XP_024578549.1 RxLR-like protein [Plasmopara halstedii]
MKLYQGLLAAALLLSRIEASYSIDKEQAKNANDAPTAPNVRVHFPTMEERINWFDPIEDVTERMEKVIESTRADNRLVIKDQMPEKLAKLRENYQRWKAELDNKPAELQLKPHGEGNQQARASKAFGRSQIYYDEHLINLQYNYDLANLNLIYAAQHEKLLGDLPRRSNIVTQTVALVKYVKKCQTLTTKFEFDKDILDAKLRYNKENLDRSHLDELTKVMNPTVDSRSPQDLLKEACLKLKYKPVVKPQIDWKMVFGSPEYRVLYD